jgi:hypothetical protein
VVSELCVGGDYFGGERKRARDRERERSSPTSESVCVCVFSQLVVDFV